MGTISQGILKAPNRSNYFKTIQNVVSLTPQTATAGIFYPPKSTRLFFTAGGAESLPILGSGHRFRFIFGWTLSRGPDIFINDIFGRGVVVWGCRSNYGRNPLHCCDPYITTLFYVSPRL